MDRWDLLVVGGGPAGCAAALRARQSRLRVAVLDSSTGSRPRPGETLHPGVEPVFAQLGVWEQVRAANFHRHRGVWVEWDAQRRFEPYGRDENGEWLGLQAERARLDALLLAAAGQAGVEILRPRRALGVIRDDAGHVRGMTTDTGPLLARWVADASGRHGWLARQIGLRTEAHSPPLALRFGWRDAWRGDDDQPSLRAHPGGWTWQAPLGDGRSAWVNLRVARGTAANMRWHCVPECAGQGYFVLGDAAAVLDPSSSHGVLRALLSGMLAGHLLAAVTEGALEPDAAATAYRDWLHQQFAHDVVALRALWEKHPCAVTREAMLRGAF